MSEDYLNCVYDVETPQWEYHTNTGGWVNGGLDVGISCLDTESTERSAQQRLGKNPKVELRQNR